MPYRIVHHPKEDLRRSLGRLAYWWIHSFVVYGAGAVYGMPVSFGPERAVELLHMYALSETGHRLHNHVFLSKPKGSDKSGFAAYVACFEAAGPARFAGWARGGEVYEFLGRRYRYRAGEPMGRPVNQPRVRCLATAEGQTGLVYDTIRANFDTGPLRGIGASPFTDYTEVPTTGGLIVPSTSGAASKDGGLDTFIAADETHLWFTPALKNVFHTLTRNLVKRPGEEPWVFETTTMYKPGQASVAEETYELARLADAGRLRRDNRLLFIHRWASLPPEEWGDEAKLRAALIEAEGDAAEWLDQDRIIDEILSPNNDVGDSIRYYLNDLAASSSSWLTPQQIEAATTDEALEPGDEIALGFDGSLTNDSTALVAVRLSDNLVQLLHIQEAPSDETSRVWTVDQALVDRVVARVFEDFRVKAFFADPPYWQDHIEHWEQKWGSLLAPATRQHPIMWWTSRRAQMANAVEAAHTMLTTGELRLSRNPQLLQHLANACRGGRNDELIYKESKMSRHKIDAAVTMVVALRAAAAARAWTPREARRRDPNHGLVSQVPVSMLVPQGVRV